MRFIKTLLAVTFILFSSVSLAGESAGVGYKLIEPPMPTSTGKKIEVLEFFFYGCSHCYNMHPHLELWGKKKPKDVELILVPTMLYPQWEPMAHTFYALEALGQPHNLHTALYEAWNVKKTTLMDVATITEFVSKHGVDGKKFSEAYHSFDVQSKVTRSKQLALSYKIMGTPTLVVDGKYLINGLFPEEAMLVLNDLIEKARKNRSRKK